MYVALLTSRYNRCTGIITHRGNLYILITQNIFPVFFTHTQKTLINKTFYLIF